jgi:hypothetical protein
VSDSRRQIALLGYLIADPTQSPVTVQSAKQAGPATMATPPKRQGSGSATKSPRSPAAFSHDKLHDGSTRPLKTHTHETRHHAAMDELSTALTVAGAVAKFKRNKGKTPEEEAREDGGVEIDDDVNVPVDAPSELAKPEASDDEDEDEGAGAGAGAADEEDRPQGDERLTGGDTDEEDEESEGSSEDESDEDDAKK